MVEKQISMLEDQANATLPQLAIGGVDWKPIDSALISKVDEQLARHRHMGALDVYTSQMQDAEMKIKNLLFASNDFHDDANMYVVRTITSGNRRAPFTFNTTHLMTLLRAELHPESAPPSLKKILDQLQDLSNKISKFQSYSSMVKSYQRDPLFKDVHSVKDLEALHTKVEAEVEQASGIPDSLINNMIQLAKEYNADPVRDGVITARQSQLGIKWREIVESDVFFKDANQSDLYDVHINWHKATNRDLAIQVLSFVIRNPVVIGKDSNLKKIEEAQKVLK